MKTKRRTNRAKFEAICRGEVWCFCWNPGTSLLTAWRKGHHKKFMVSPDTIVDLAYGQMKLL